MSASPLELLQDEVVEAALRRAYQESDVGGTNPREQGGFIVRDGDGALRVDRLPAGEEDALEFPVCRDGVYNGEKIAGTFHTHPNIGTGWRQEPSQADIEFSVNFPETSGPHQFVVSKANIYHIANDGVVSTVGATTDLIF